MRIKGLDFLRGIAIIGVLFRHFEIPFFLAGPGGYGVDLFFVLSGFLVSGLLFNEYKKRNTVNIKRFLIRRGFKIYPAFYFLIICSILIYAIGFGNYFNTSSILSEIFFLQSYITPMWMQTWSLAIEEHFYLLVSLFIFLAIKYRWIENRKTMLLFLTGMILLVFSFRLYHCLTIFANTREAFFATHLRMDGLLTGTLLSYLWHFQYSSIEKFYRRKKLFAVLTSVLIIPAFVFRTDSMFMVTIGFNLLHIVFAMMILFAVSKEGESILFGNSFARKISSAICFTGVYSYTIYLWHLLVQNLLLRVITDLRMEAVVYFFTSIAVGVFASLLSEKPFLKIREKHFPKVT